MKKQFKILAVLCVLLAGMLIVSTTSYGAAGDAYDLKISGTYNYASGQEMINYINEERAAQGADALTLDKELTDAAMQRAAEIAVEFSHTRPNGESCFSICDKANGENIAAGNSSASATYTQWENSAGHYANMMNTYFTSIGIGHFKHNGQNYWVQLFSDSVAETSENRFGTENITTDVSIVEKSGYGMQFNLRELSEGEVIELTANDTFQLETGMVNSGWSYVYGVFDPDSFDWKSGNETVAAVSSEGLVTGKSAGQTTITATVNNGAKTAVSIDVKVFNDIASTTVSALVDKTYTGSGVTQDVKVSYNGAVLAEGTDYTISYRNNTEIGTAYMDIKGIGDFRGEITKTFKIQAPSVPAPENVTVQLVKGKYDAVHASWSKVSVTGNTVKYSVQYKVGNGSWATVGGGTNKTEVTIKDLAGGKAYYVRITPYVTIGGEIFTGPAKDSAAVYTLKKLNKPSVKKAGKNKVKVAWNNIDGESGYEVYRSAKKAKGYKLAKRVTSTTAKSTTFKVEKKKTYYYKVRAFKTIKINGKTYDVYGPWSSVKRYKLR